MLRVRGKINVFKICIVKIGKGDIDWLMFTCLFYVEHHIFYA